ncbi:LOW QUALITY PROTEIN: 2-hydroxymuconic semialdehyde hydrolase [Limimaricola cinnabarinus LL-001]|uniref:Palmitoyl-protein thioesterase ABHD10, mitochondrial n=1 Tax=Limimaricola cinnabarinus LL-001 TaxID=1337093 RepID=U3A8M6_9RHOB|nr:LOW QUALITY PROTEIN: 2-hydroxymuconic semialdehyde hydrolase [Limimaricola cinnabarinus LL-001]
MPEFTSPQGRRIAYDHTPGEGPGVVFLGGFRSDKEGTKAVFLEDWAKRQGRAFLRFDYSAMAAAAARSRRGRIGDWAEDAAAALSLTRGPQILVGSSMGGWISLLLARAVPEKVAGLVTIAAAPDFTEDGFWAGMTGEMRTRFEVEGYLDHPSDYGDPLRITRRLIEEGRGNLVLRSPLLLPFPVRFLQGTADEDVSVATALRLFEHAEGPDMRLTLVDGADHRFSTPDCLDLIASSVAEISARA